MSATLDEQIELLRSQGILFSLASVDEAKAFLTHNTYFFKLKGYRANYEKNSQSSQYEGLDFAHLIELSKLDFHLSRLCLSMCMAIEHSVKIRLNQQMMDCGDAKQVLDAGESFRLNYEPNIRSNPYTEDLVDLKGPDFRPWHMWELMSFSDQVQLYASLSDALGVEGADTNRRMLFVVQKLRNAVSHGNCLLTDMSRPSPSMKKKGKSDTSVSVAARWICDAPRRARNKRTNSFLRSLDRLIVHNYTALLFCYLEFVSSEGMRRHIIKDVESFVQRVRRNKDSYFGDAALPGDSSRPEKPRNELVLTTLDTLIQLSEGFVKKLATVPHQNAHELI